MPLILDQRDTGMPEIVMIGALLPLSLVIIAKTMIRYLSARLRSRR
jgi:hypothetical protein